MITAAILAGLLFGATAQAEDADWTKKAVELWAKADFDGAQKLADDSEGGPQNGPRIVRLFCNLERWVQQRDAQASVAFKQDYKPLYVAIRAEDVEILHAFETSGGAYAKKYAAGLLEGAYEKVGALTDEKEIVRFLGSSDPKGAVAASAALAKVLAPRRGIVTEGGTISQKDQRIFTDAKVIRSLIALLKEDMSQSIKDLIPGKLRAKAGMAGPKACLVLIEAPALGALTTAVAEGDKSALAAQTKLKAAIMERLQKHPSSSWASADGTEPLGGYVLPRCPTDARAFMPGTESCTVCQGELVGGKEATGEGIPGKGATAARCLECDTALASGGKFCEKCGEKVPPPKPEKQTCPECGHIAGGDARFCRECGTKLGD